MCFSTVQLSRERSAEWWGVWGLRWCYLSFQLQRSLNSVFGLNCLACTGNAMIFIFCVCPMSVYQYTTESTRRAARENIHSCKPSRFVGFEQQIRSNQSIKVELRALWWHSRNCSNRFWKKHDVIRSQVGMQEPPWEWNQRIKKCWSQQSTKPRMIDTKLRKQIRHTNPKLSSLINNHNETSRSDRISNHNRHPCSRRRCGLHIIARHTKWLAKHGSRI